MRWGPGLLGVALAPIKLMKDLLFSLLGSGKKQFVPACAVLLIYQVLVGIKTEITAVNIQMTKGIAVLDTRVDNQETDISDINQRIEKVRDRIDWLHNGSASRALIKPKQKLSVDSSYLGPS